MFRFRFGAKSAEPEPNRTVASVQPKVSSVLPLRTVPAPWGLGILVQVAMAWGRYALATAMASHLLNTQGSPNYQLDNATKTWIIFKLLIQIPV